IEIGSATLFGQNTGEYQTSFSGFVTLNPGDSINFDVVFTPTVPGTKSAGLRFDVEGASAPHVLLFNGWSRYPLTSDLGVDIEELEFGQTIQGNNVNKTITLTNLGEPDAPLINVYGIDLSGDTPQAFDPQFNSIQLAPGQSAKVTIAMSGAALGHKAADVLISHDGNNPALETKFAGQVVKPQNVPINFGKSTLNNVSTERATSLQFGPDGKLYVAELDGTIHVFGIVRNAKNNYTGTKLETILLIKNVVNHNDSGVLQADVKGRTLTGIFVTGTAAAPVIYAASSDPRHAAGPSGKDANLDTNSGILHRLTKNAGGWSKQDLVRGLPRSEENHVPNGLLMYGNKILLAMGGNTNMGMPSNNFAELAEYALSTAILEIDINAIGNGTHDLPTLDDEDRPGVNDNNDPFGGNDGKNQAKLMQSGPVKLFATGFRNVFDITLTDSGKIYVFDNGPNPGWGGKPNANCANNVDNGGVHNWDNLHLVTKNFYAGHPNPTRGNKNNKFNNANPQSPIEGPARPEECDYKEPGAGDGALTTIQSSSNGLDEYTASNFAGSMKGDLLVASFNKSIYRLELNDAGTKVTSKSQLVTNLGNIPLDLTVQGDDDAYPGTIWVADNLANTITILEPADY
ncbi:MAG: choice-of-anchor D domain-containing protein, partial [Gammaproteobacteria bacterium]|nr:choice-of-anchor D domain-containing protein [Gammaproteobacteria bacterium]